MKDCKITDYQDYRIYLRDWYAHAKSTRRGFSFRLFSKKAGLQSPNFLKLVMDGDRNLSEEGIRKFIRGLELGKTEADYFRNLVNFTQAENPSEKIEFERLLFRSKKIANTEPLKRDLYELYASWHHPVVLELITSESFDGSTQSLVEKIYPRLSESSIQKSIELLERLGFIKKNDCGRYENSQPVVTTGPESDSLVLLSYHQNLLHLAARVLLHVPQHVRDVSALTIGLERSRVDELKEMIRDFRKEVIRRFTTDKPVEEVVMLNLQMFPVTRFEK